MLLFPLGFAFTILFFITPCILPQHFTFSITLLCCLRLLNFIANKVVPLDLYNYYMKSCAVVLVPNFVVFNTRRTFPFLTQSWFISMGVRTLGVETFNIRDTSSPLEESWWLRSTTGWECLVSIRLFITTGWECLVSNRLFITTGWECLVSNRLFITF